MALIRNIENVIFRIKSFFLAIVFFFTALGYADAPTELDCQVQIDMERCVVREATA